MTPEKIRNINHELSECSNMLYFLTTSIINLFETGEQLTDEEKCGAQTCFFTLHDRLKAVITAIEGKSNNDL